jgi:hypothetical protein
MPRTMIILNNQLHMTLKINTQAIIEAKYS